jgi:hypothetical protein
MRVRDFNPGGASQPMDKDESEVLTADLFTGSMATAGSCPDHRKFYHIVYLSSGDIASAVLSRPSNH